MLARPQHWSFTDRVQTVAYFLCFSIDHSHFSPLGDRMFNNLMLSMTLLLRQQSYVCRVTERDNPQEVKLVLQFKWGLTQEHLVALTWLHNNTR